MSSVTDIYTKHYSEERKKEFEDRVREMEDGVMSEESIASMVAAEMREGKKSGGRMGFRAGGIIAAGEIIAGWVAKQIAKKTAKPVTQKSIDFSSDAIVKRLDNYNIKPDDIVSEDQLLKVLDSVKQAENNVFNNKFGNIIEQGMEGISKLKKAEGGRIGFSKGKAVMTLADAIRRLTKGYIKVTGKKPEGLDVLKIKMEAAQKVKDANKVVDMSGNVIDTSKGIMGGKQILENKEMTKSLKEALMKTDNPFSDLVNFEKKVLSKTPQQRRIEAEEALRNKNVVPIKDPLDMATGGRAGYYGGGQAMVGEDMSDIGHGSDALMARNMQIAPGGQATTSTGLNYLLGQDNDTARVPYNEGNMVLPKPKPKNFLKTLDMLNTKAAANTLDTKTYANLVGEFAKKAFDNGELSEVEYMRIIQPLFGEVGEMVTNQIQDDQNYLEKYADGGRIGYASKGDVSLLDFINVNASGSKSGKNQIQGAPKGITVDNQTINAIIDLDIPINEKINILGSYAYGKGRNKIEKGDKELFLDEGGYKDRNIGLGFNQGGEGLSGSVIRNLETGDDDVQIKFLKKFSKGGIAGMLGE